MHSTRARVGNMAFIAFEGGEACGKSTQLELLWRHFCGKGLESRCLKTREPGGTPLAENIRTLFKSVPTHGDLPTPHTELMLVMAARAQHFEKVIKPSLAGETPESRFWILCDRFLDSSYVYQSYVGGIEKSYVDAVARGFLGDWMPDLTFVFTLPETIAKARLALRPGPRDRLDDFDTETFRKLNAGFEWLVHSKVTYPNGRTPVRILLDGTKSPEELHHEVVAHLAKEKL